MWSRLAQAGAGALLATRAVDPSVLGSQIDAIISRPTFLNASVGVQIREVNATDSILYSHNEYRSFIPASNHKLFVSSSALWKLGANFTYNTTVLATAPVDPTGCLSGDVWLVGSGDPSLTSARLDVLAEALVNQTGLRKITGSVFGDGTAFDHELLGTGWSWDDEPYYYSAQFAGLNCDQNVITVTVAPGNAVGAPARVTVNGLGLDTEKYVTVESSVTTSAAGQGNNVAFDRLRGRNIVVLSGSVSSTYSFKTTIEEPTSFTAYRFAVALQKKGVKVSTVPTKPGKAPSSATAVTKSISPPFSTILKQFLKPSDNMYGEAILKTMGRVANPGSAGTASLGARVMRAFVASAGIVDSGVYIMDGSGLSWQNRLTPQFVADVLLHNRVALSPSDWAVYYDALPIGGVDGTLANRFVGTPVQGKVRGKTGTLTAVSSLSGYVTASSGKEYVFSILMNHFTSSADAQRAQEDIVLALYYSS